MSFEIIFPATPHLEITYTQSITQWTEFFLFFAEGDAVFQMKGHVWFADVTFPYILIKMDGFVSQD